MLSTILMSMCRYNVVSKVESSVVDSCYCKKKLQYMSYELHYLRQVLYVPKLGVYPNWLIAVIERGQHYPPLILLSWEWGE